MNEDTEQAPSNKDKISQQSPAINKAYVIVSLIIVGIVAVGYFTIGKAEIAGSYVQEESLSEPYYELEVEIANSGRTTLLEKDYTNDATLELIFDTQYDETLDAYVYNPEKDVELTYAIDTQSVAVYGLPPQFELFEESYGFSREDDAEAVILTGQVAEEDIEILNLNFHELQINAADDGIFLNDIKFINR